KRYNSTLICKIISFLKLPSFTANTSNRIPKIELTKHQTKLVQKSIKKRIKRDSLNISGFVINKLNPQKQETILI
ncbi:hypothetical protein ACKUCE_12080, partial [Flavobacterium psychrophilum]|uniref:hypothetical protein n=1 Tax=Flavobacterium psychrophilum TaxID=96345 RepID=UPI0036FB5CAD